MMSDSLRRPIARLLIVSLIWVQSVQAGVLTIASAPLAFSVSSVVRPNIMYVLDDSGSMAWDYTPDYVNDSTSSSSRTTGLCWGTSSGTRGGTPNDTNAASQCTNFYQVPYSTGDVNFQFYDPTVRYAPPLRADSTSYANASTTAAPNDGFGLSGGTLNLTTGWTHEVWCNSSTAAPSSADPTAGGKCLENVNTTGDILYPDATHVFPKTYSGRASYFVMDPTEFCTDDSGTTCIRSTTANTLAGLSYNVPFTYRWCSSYSTATHAFSGCQARRDATHYLPNYLGGWVGTLGSSGTYATASLILSSITVGQSISSIMVGGTEVLGSAVTVETGDTVEQIAGVICTKIHNLSLSTGYDCPTAPTSNTLVIQALERGATANGQPVLVYGPAGAAGANSTGSVTVVYPTTAGRQISQVAVNGNNLLAGTVTSDGVVDTTAASLCNAINSGPNNATYKARLGPAGTAWGTCLAYSTGEVEILRVPMDATDNGAAIVVSGPVAGSIYTGSITVNSIGGQTRINDITIGGVSVLSSKPLTYTDGTATTAIAADIASNFSMAGCTATASGNVVSITGSASCNAAVAVTAPGVAATGVMRVASTGQARPADLGGIQISAANIVGHLDTTQITNGTAVSTNATTIRNAINASGTGFSAAVPVANGSNYDITVTAPAGNGNNGRSFTFLDGSSGGATGGSAPQWTFDITGASADNAKITSITCGGTNTIATNTATTGASSPTVDYIYNLSVNGATNGLNGRSYNGYSYACTTPTATTPSSTCTLTGPAGAAACNNLSFRYDWSSGISVNNSSAPTSVGTRTNAGSAGSATWTFPITGATTDNKSITGITCGGTATISGSASTGTTASAAYASTLANDIQTQALAGNGDWSGQAESCSASGSTVSCTLCRRSGSQYRCSGGASGVTVTPANGSGLSVGSITETWNSGGNNRYCYNFNITGASSANQLINQIACSGETAVNSATTGPAVYSAGVQRINNLATGLGSRGTNSYAYTCTPATDANPSASCSVSGPDNCTDLNFTFSSSSGITVGSRSKTSTAATSPTWQFSITGATTANKNIQSIQCGGTNTFNTFSQPSTGSSTGGTVYGRINNLTQGGGTGLQSIGTGGYSYACTTASSGTQRSTCTVTGPVGAAACSTLTIARDNSISTGASTQTAAGGAGGSAWDNFRPSLSQVSAFSGGYAGQPTTANGITNVVVSAINTTTTSMSNGQAPSTLTIPTNAAAGTLALQGGTAASSANHWTGLGTFRRIDIVPTNNTYNRYSARTDCAGSTCTYNEELQNFANWYTYYRTRVNMMKSVSTQVFSTLNGDFRVGFDNISNCQSTCATTVVEPVAQFIDNGERSNQRSNWWNNLTGTAPSSNTPLRAEVAKIGRYYAGQLTINSAHPDPMQYSCQKNFTILVTDGYWNEAESAQIKGVAGADIGNTDNNAQTAPRPFFDGQSSPTACPAINSRNVRSGASSCRTLADVTWYYYSTDLRSSTFGNATNAATGQDVATNNVPKLLDSDNDAQHMKFFAMGLGVDGTLLYKSDYDTAGFGDYYDILHAGDPGYPTPRDWPAVANLDPTGIDDLWHAAVNGHGKYFSARNPVSARLGLTEALTAIRADRGSASAAGVSSQEPVAGDNYAFRASYKTVEWSGDVLAYTIDLDTGARSATAFWSAQANLDTLPSFTSRNIYVAPVSASSGADLRLFTYSALTAAEKAYFSPTSLAQYPALSVTNPNDITAEKLVEYLRGDRSIEQDGGAHAQVWRKRAHLLGDIVDSQPYYLKAPVYSYTDDGYAAFKTATASRRSIIYVGANDGMLHAFDALTGEERWAFIPQQAMSGIATLADINYQHRNFVNGQINVGDVKFSDGTWHSVLVAGMGTGGESYFALDVTDPDNPRYLWEFADARLGKAISLAPVSKLPNGEWAVFFSSGYNNTADGAGYLFALDPQTGALKSGFPMSTLSGNAASPSNLGKIAVWVDNIAFNNTAKFVYAGDTNGDVWRFDLDPTADGHSGTAVFKLAHLADADGNAQPITTTPILTRVGGFNAVYVGTGKYLGLPDLSVTTTQTFYAIKDTLGVRNLATDTQETWHPRSDTGSVSGSTVNLFMQRKWFQTLDDGTPIVSAAGQADRAVCPASAVAVSASSGNCVNAAGVTPTDPAMDWGSYGGWYVDFPQAGERMNVDPQLALGTLVFATNTPASTVCTAGGSSFAASFDYKTGLKVGGGNEGGAIVGRLIANSLTVGLAILLLRGTDATQEPRMVVIPYGAQPGGGGGTGGTGEDPLAVDYAHATFQSKRGLWREIEVY